MPTYRPTTSEDVIALAPLLLGFHPEESLVVLTFDPPGSAQLRIDLPDVEEAITKAIDAQLLGTRVALIAFAADLDQATAAMRTATALLPPASLAAALHVHDREWRPWLSTHFPRAGVAFDPDTHPWLLQAHFDGRGIYASRSHLEASLRGDTTLMEAELDYAYARVEQLLETGNPEWVPLMSEWALDRIANWVRAGDLISPSEAALLAVIAQFADVQHHILAHIPQPLPYSWSATMAQLAAGTPDSLAVGMLCLTGQVALRCGNNTLASRALDEARLLHADSPMVTSLEHRLAEAIPFTTGT